MVTKIDPIENKRNEIDAIDLKLMKLLKARIQIVDELKILKRASNLSMLQKLQEQRKTKMFHDFAESHNLDKAHYSAFYNCLHEIALDIQR